MLPPHLRAGAQAASAAALALREHSQLPLVTSNSLQRPAELWGFLLPLSLTRVRVGVTRPHRTLCSHRGWGRSHLVTSEEERWNTPRRKQLGVGHLHYRDHDVPKPLARRGRTALVSAQESSASTQHAHHVPHTHQAQPSGQQAEGRATLGTGPWHLGAGPLRRPQRTRDSEARGPRCPGRGDGESLTGPGGGRGRQRAGQPSLPTWRCYKCLPCGNCQAARLCILC